MKRDSTLTSIRIQSVCILLLSLGLIAFGFGILLSRAIIALDGTIIQRHTACDPSNQARCSTTYIIANAQNIVTYTADPNEQSLVQSLPIGTTLKKQR